ncbi:MAG: cell filamentation protein Fic [Methanosarcinales archaeon]|nr:MAG: cell filamentation protein Fic [Methanosarcinales archaeon]
MTEINNKLSRNNTYNEFLLYTTPNGNVKVEIFLHDENIWLTQEKIAMLFGVQRPAITKHLKNIFESNELIENSVSSILEHTAKDGKKYQTKYYNLDAIISVGYRVNSTQATHFRIWATERLKEYIIKGFTMDDERLKNPNNVFGKDYFEEQLARIRDIRSSERRFYQKITDIYAQCSADYDSRSEVTQRFFATVQNKLHWAISRQTAAEIIYSRADSQKQNMGLTTWKNAPKGKIRKFDVSVAKNYLNEDELNQLNRIVSMYLDYAEMQANNHRMISMKEWVTKLDAFLQFNEKDILTNNITVTAEIAKTFAENQYEQCCIIQDRILESDFDTHIKRILAKAQDEKQ